MNEILVSTAIAYLFFGLYLNFTSRSRGALADTLFVLFWIFYMIDDWRKGRL